MAAPEGLYATWIDFPTGSVFCSPMHQCRSLYVKFGNDAFIQIDPTLPNQPDFFPEDTELERGLLFMGCVPATHLRMIFEDRFSLCQRFYKPSGVSSPSFISFYPFTALTPISATRLFSQDTRKVKLTDFLCIDTVGLSWHDGNFNAIVDIPEGRSISILSFSVQQNSLNLRYDTSISLFQEECFNCKLEPYLIVKDDGSPLMTQKGSVFLSMAICSVKDIAAGDRIIIDKNYEQTTLQDITIG